MQDFIVSVIFHLKLQTGIQLHLKTRITFTKLILNIGDFLQNQENLTAK